MILPTEAGPASLPPFTFGTFALRALDAVAARLDQCSCVAEWEPSSATPLRFEAPVRASARLGFSLPRHRLYERCRDPEQLPRLFPRLVAVKALTGARFRWLTSTGQGARWGGTALLMEDLPGEKLTWRSPSGATLRFCGEAIFHPGPRGRGSVVTLTVALDVPSARNLPMARRLLGPAFSVSLTAGLHQGLHALQAQLDAESASLGSWGQRIHPSSIAPRT